MWNTFYLDMEQRYVERISVQRVLWQLVIAHRTNLMLDAPMCPHLRWTECSSCLSACLPPSLERARARSLCKLLSCTLTPAVTGGRAHHDCAAIQVGGCTARAHPSPLAPTATTSRHLRAHARAQHHTTIIIISITRTRARTHTHPHTMLTPSTHKHTVNQAPSPLDPTCTKRLGFLVLEIILVIVAVVNVCGQGGGII
jgi:hypothetical protein